MGMTLTTPTTTQQQLVEDLDVLHAFYIASVNAAIASGDEGVAAELAAAYDRDATALVAVRAA